MPSTGETSGTGGQVVGPAAAAQTVVNAADIIIHTHPTQARALLRTAAELFDLAGLASQATRVRETVAALKAATPRERHRPGLGRPQVRPS